MQNWLKIFHKICTNVTLNMYTTFWRFSGCFLKILQNLLKISIFFKFLQPFLKTSYDEFYSRFPQILLTDYSNFIQNFTYNIQKFF